MIDPKADSGEKLSQARRLFEEMVDHYDGANSERHRVGRFVHNSLFEGQWEEEDRQYLEDEGRPAMSFNLMRGQIVRAIGQHKDLEREARAVPIGSEDQFKAEVLNAVCACNERKAGLETANAETMWEAYVKGEGNTVLDVADNPENPSRIMMDFNSVSPHEILWDQSSRKPDRSDAGCVTWDKWLTKAEFFQEYPEHTDKWDELKGQSAGSELDPHVIPQGERDGWDTDDRDYRHQSYYWDRTQNRARVVHMEYRATKKLTFGVRDGKASPLDAEEVTMIQEDVFGQFEDVTIKRTLGIEVHVIEFSGVEVLYDSTDEKNLPALPFDGFSPVPFVWAMDTEENIPYGMGRNLLDPQRELNKSWSASLEQSVGQNQPGYLAEEGAIPDIHQFELEVGTSGSVATVAAGAITGGKIQPRSVPQISPAVEARLSRSVEMMDRISGTTANMDTQATQNEPAANAALRFHKSNQAMASVRENFDRYLIQLKKKQIQAVMRSMPDDQIQALLGNDEKYVVQQGVVIELGPHPENPQQKVPTGRKASLRDLRSMEYDIELETSGKNTSIRNIKLNQWGELMRIGGVPIDPLMLIEATTDSRSETERLLKYAKEQGQTAAQNAAREAEAADAQFKHAIAVQDRETAEKSRHNQATEALTALDQASDTATKIAGILEKADENEKSRILTAFSMFQQRETAREAAALRGAR